MKTGIKYAFILDKDEFVRLSLNRILNRYGFKVEEIGVLSQLEDRKKEIDRGIVLADIEVDALEQWFPLMKKWNQRFIFMSPLITEELKVRLKKMGLRRMIKKPVEPRLLKRVIREICPSVDGPRPSPVKGRSKDCHSVQKGGESA